jgi:hypothetical protein
MKLIRDALEALVNSENLKINILPVIIRTCQHIKARFDQNAFQNLGYSQVEEIKKPFFISST